jgi:hypothetical protein
MVIALKPCSAKSWALRTRKLFPAVATGAGSHGGLELKHGSGVMPVSPSLPENKTAIALYGDGSFVMYPTVI